MAKIEVESSYRFLYLRHGEDRLYVTYQYDDLKAMMVEEGASNCYLIVDLKGESHMLLISPKLASIEQDTDKKKIATDLYLAYWDQYRKDHQSINHFVDVNKKDT